MNPLTQTLPTVPVDVSAPMEAASSHGCIDADKVAALMDRVQAWNARQLPAVEMAVGALEFLATGRSDGFERALDAPPPKGRGEACRTSSFKWSIPEMIDSARQRDVCFHYTLGMDRDLIALGNQMSRGWEQLPESCKTLKPRALQPSPSSRGASRSGDCKEPPSFFKDLVDTLKEGDSMMLILPSNDLLLVARAQGNQLIAVAPDELWQPPRERPSKLGKPPAVRPSKVYAGFGAQERFDRAHYMRGSGSWAILKPQ